MACDDRVESAAPRRARVGELELAYETFGSAGDPALLLIMGLASQMLAWPDEFCTSLRGGLPRDPLRQPRRRALPHLTGVPAPDPVKLMRGDTSDAAYRLEDMADDAVRLLAALDIERAHIVGVSMGGMIAQTVAIRHPQRTLSLTSVMATPAPYIGPPTPRAQAVLLMPPPASRRSRPRRPRGLPGDRVAGLSARRGGRRRRGAPQLRPRLGPGRGAPPAGRHRRVGGPTAALRKLTVPALVIHGAADPLVTVEGGQLRAAVTGSRLIVIPGMGHDLPRAVWPVIIDAIAALAKNA